jgi:hypothetical protein
MTDEPRGCSSDPARSLSRRAVAAASNLFGKRYIETIGVSQLPGICPFCANSTWRENLAEHGKVAVQILR